MKKVVIFNVGGALSSYIEVDDKKIVVDLGKHTDFSPVENFLIPLFRKKQNPMFNNVEDSFFVNQLIISHPHKDHLSDIRNFKEKFDTGKISLLTTPNKNNGQEDEYKIKSQLITTPDDEDIKCLFGMCEGRYPPLKSVDEEILTIDYIKPGYIENDENLKNNYTNNLSILTHLNINGHSLLFSGDIMKEGMEYILENGVLKEKLENGLDFLICPHHGLKSSFPQSLFNILPNNKVNRLNIISEKVNTDDNREVDSRYYTNEFCEGNNNLEQYGLKTSKGHIVINLDNNEPIITTYSNDELDNLINEFI